MVILAACQSAFAGKIFLKCGAKHVICVKNKRELLDAAAIDFTNTFYKALFSGKCVCAAFESGKDAVELVHGFKEADLFVIYTHEQMEELNPSNV